MIRIPNQRNIIPSTAFYDAIAEDYDSQLEELNQKVRKAVAVTLKRYFQEGLALDFGGGTGLDLHWLKDNYRVYFLEPSSRMRSVAKRNFSGHQNIVFLEDKLNFSEWSPANLPFNDKPDAILMNLAVFNCIEDINTLVKQLSLITKPGSVIIAAILRYSAWHQFRQGNWRNAVNAVFRKGIVYSNYKNLSHPAYLHTQNDIKRAIKGSFELGELRTLQGTPYKLMVLKKT